MLMDKIKKFFSNKNANEVDKGEIAEKGIKSDKKKLENLAVFLTILIITILVINYIWNGEEKTDGNDTQTSDANKKLASGMSTGQIANNEGKEKIEQTVDKNSVETELEEILAKINGVGEVKVMITYSETNKIMPVYNEESSEENTEETDSEGRNKESITNRHEKRSDI